MLFSETLVPLFHLLCFLFLSVDEPWFISHYSSKTEMITEEITKAFVGPGTTAMTGVSICKIIFHLSFFSSTSRKSVLRPPAHFWFVFNLFSLHFLNKLNNEIVLF